MMLQSVSDFFGTENFMPHGHCFLWIPSILWLQVMSDIIIALSYYSIPLTLFYFARRRADIPFRRIFFLFASFICLCGTTHIMEIWVIWNPLYGLEGVLKALTAAASVCTAVIIWQVVPLALTLKSPSELARINGQLEEAYAATEQKVEERTAELRNLSERLNSEVQEKEAINLQLQSALVAAEAANRAKSDFLANMSHEIRTPMNAVVGLSNLLQSGNLSAERRAEFIKTIQLSAQSLMELINDLLDIAKLESEHMELESVSFNLAELVEEIISIMSVKSKEKGLELVVKYDKRLNENFVGDPLRLRQILMNLVSNAIKFTEKGSMTVHVEACRHQRNGHTNVCMDISDTGIGIAAAKLETIFSKFSQADTSITRKFGGTGLGLSISKTLVELMGGKIAVVSTIGLGSKFSLEIPLLPAGTEHPRKDRNPKAGGSNASPEIAETQALILLVEDYKANVMVATSTIENCGYRWHLAENGIEALEKFKAGSYDLVLMDVQMPELDGISATLAIRAYEQSQDRPATPILGLTAYSETKDQQKCLDAGMNDFLTKPFDTEELKERMRTLIRRKS